MDSLKLKWVYGSTHRAQDVSNEAVDKYKTIVEQLYLDQNRTREEVLSHLQDFHGFSLSANQFSKATKRWGFYKQPRRVQTSIQPPESITEEDEAPNPLDPLEELFDFGPDVLDTIDETEACFQDSNENVANSKILEDVQEQLSYTGRGFVSEPPPSINHSLPQAMDVDSPHDAVLCDADRSLPESSKRQPQHINAVRRLEVGPYSIISKKLAQVSFNNHINKSRVDYLTCCYLFQEAVDCLESSVKSVGKREDRVPRSNIDKLFEPYHRDKDKLLANPIIPLDMWSILCLIEPNQVSIPDDLLDRLDINDLQFMKAVDVCLGLCKKWIELVIKGLPNGALQFHNFHLHVTADKVLYSLCRPLIIHDSLDIWQEAGYLFAFVWGNEQREATNDPSWLAEAEISGLSPTHFLAIICRMIVDIMPLPTTGLSMIPSSIISAAKCICGDYLEGIQKIKRTDQSSSRGLKTLFIKHLFTHHKTHNIREITNLENVQSYQRAAANFVFEEERDTLAQKVPQANPFHGDAWMTKFSSLASSKSTSSGSHSSNYSYANQQNLTLLSSNPTMTRSLASGSSRGSSLNSFKALQAASRAMATCLKEDRVNS